MLNPQQLKSFKQDGYLLVKGLFSSTQIQNITAWTDDVMAYPEVPGKYMMYFEQSQLCHDERILCRLENFAPYYTNFNQLFTAPTTLGIVSELFAEPAVLFKDKINFKLPGGEGFKAHQDAQAGWAKYASLHITALITIDDCSVENGCLEIVAGQHKQGLLGQEWKPLDENALDYTPLETLPGDVVFFDSYTPHRSKPNFTNKPRRVLYITYNRAAEGDQRSAYYRDKRQSFPPDCEREAGNEYTFKV